MCVCVCQKIYLTVTRAWVGAENLFASLGGGGGSESSQSIKNISSIWIHGSLVPVKPVF